MFLGGLSLRAIVNSASHVSFSFWTWASLDKFFSVMVEALEGKWESQGPGLGTGLISLLTSAIGQN